jgi:hypothetical protein
LGESQFLCDPILWGRPYGKPAATSAPFCGFAPPWQAAVCGPDLLGVSSTVRALGLAARCYDRLLDFFHSPAIDPDTLSRLWTRLALQRFSPHRLGGVLVHLGIFACFVPLYPPTYRRAHLRKPWLFPRFRKRQRMVQQCLS